MNSHIVLTQDGSHTLSLDGSSEHYHSVFGAISESEHVFINAGLKAVDKDIRELNILEIGFGTGLNAFLTYLRRENDQKINYTSIEANPIDIEIATALNYPDKLGAVDERTKFEYLHHCDWNVFFQINQSFNFRKIKGKLQDNQLENNYQLIYYDAFAPSAQPEMWTKEIFEKLFESLSVNGFLVTYCAKGTVKRILKETGFMVESLPGPHRKREMTRAIKK